MTPELKSAILAQQKAGTKLFYYSGQQHPGVHSNIEFCLECNCILIPSTLRDEVEQ